MNIKYLSKIFIYFVAILSIFEISLQIIKLKPALKITNADDYRYFLSDNPKLGYEILPNQKNRINYFGQLLNIWTNKNGLRDLERNYQTKVKEKRIVFLGDSVLMGSEFQISHLPTVKLEQLLNKNENKYEVFNISYDGYNTEAEVELLSQKVNINNLDLVVVNYVRNDTLNFTVDLDFNEKTILSKYLWEFFPQLKKSHILLWGIYYYQKYIQNKLIKKQKQLFSNNIANGLEQLSKLALNNRFEVLVLIWPEFLKNNQLANCEQIDNEVKCHDKEKLIVENISDKLKIKSIRLDQFFIKRFKDNKDLRGFLTEDGMHPLNNKGEEIAQVFYDALKSNVSWIK